MADISLLPDQMRGKEEEVRPKKPTEKTTSAGGLKMHVPEAGVDEDIEIIEVDEGDLPAVLSDEPFMTRLTYRISSALDKLKYKLFGKKPAVPPPKLPPQFFKPPKAGLVTKPPTPLKAGAPEAPGKPKARITPREEVPRRVRVIKRVRRPVRVSLISAEELAALSVDVGKRKWTISVVAFLFIAIIAAGYYLINEQVGESRSRLASVTDQLNDMRALIQERQQDWKQYEDLQERLTLLNDVLNKHIMISRMFDFLELRTLPTVAYRSATWSEDGQLVLDVICDSYDSAARQLVAFDNSETVLNAEATSFSKVQAEGGFEVSFQLILELDADSLRGPLLVQESEDVEAMRESGTPTAAAIE